ncbi:MAG: hypothetical protein Q9162_007841 [Coniocarpon cinnabarinum]
MSRRQQNPPRRGTGPPPPPQNVAQQIASTPSTPTQSMHMPSIGTAMNRPNPAFSQQLTMSLNNLQAGLPKTVDGLIEYFNTQQEIIVNRSERAGLQEQIMDALIGFNRGFTEAIVQFWDWVLEDKALQDRFGSLQAVYDRFPEANQIRDQHRSQQDRVNRLQERLREMAPGYDVRLLARNTTATESLLQNFINSINKHGIKKALAAANCIMVRRAHQREPFKGPGNRRHPYYLPGDFNVNRVDEFLTNATWYDNGQIMTDAQIGYDGFKRLGGGFLVQQSAEARCTGAAQASVVGEAMESVENSDPSTVLSPRRPDMPTSPIYAAQGSSVSHYRPDADRDWDLVRMRESLSNEEVTRLRALDEPLEEPRSFEENIRRSKRIKGLGLKRYGDEPEEDEDPERSRRERSVSSQISLLSMSPARPQDFPVEEEIQHCKQCPRRCQTFAKEMSLTRQARQAARGEAVLISNLTLYENARNKKTVKPCFYHVQRLMGRLGLATKGCDHTESLQRCDHMASCKSKIGDVRADEAFHEWFVKSARPHHKSDSLGAYAFWAATPTKLTVKPQPVLVYMLQYGVGHPREGSWFDQGSIIAPIFQWWKSQDVQVTHTAGGKPHTYRIIDLMRLEFDMYNHHLRRPAHGRNHMGWQRSQWYSLSQQMMRMDPVYYLFYVLHRADLGWRLISYPYYVKYAKPGDNTFFRHIDINTAEAARSGANINMIQGSVSLDDEDDANCTEILPGMHKEARFKEWFKDVKSRHPHIENCLDNMVSTIKPTYWTAEDAQKFKTDWKKVPCKAGDARLTHPCLPHGSTGKATRVRRTMLPWFVKIQEDHEVMENTSMGTFDMLSIAHRDQTAPLRSPSGKPNIYSTIPFAFPAGVQLRIDSELSDALVGRVKWSSPHVLRERDYLLQATNPGTIPGFVNDWRRKATEAFGKAFSKMELAERTLFGNDYSFFINRDNGTLAEAAQRQLQSRDEGYELATGNEGGLHGAEDNA